MDIVGGIFFIIGLTTEAISDQQKFSFRNDPENRGKWCQVGLWKISRHPNYFGEITLWIGVFLISTSICTGAQWAGILSPLFTASILLFVRLVLFIHAYNITYFTTHPCREKTFGLKFSPRKDLQ